MIAPQSFIVSTAVFVALHGAIASAAVIPPDYEILQPELGGDQGGIAFFNTTAPRHPDPRVHQILDFWFDPRYDFAHWFRIDPDFDKEIADKFGDLVSVARDTTELDGWSQSSQGDLALLILLDQFPRNIYRDSAQAYAADAKALRMAKEGVRHHADIGVSLIAQVFYYLPYMHDETVQSQKDGVALYRTLVERCHSPPTSKDRSFLESSVKFAIRHQIVIQKFGRFPIRNKVLGRKSTAEELQWLKTHPYGY